MPNEPTFRPGQQHPEAWREDLNPNRMAGQNIGLDNPHPEQTGEREVTRFVYGDEDAQPDGGQQDGNHGRAV